MNIKTNHKGGAPKELHWVTNLSDFDLGRPVTLLTAQAWPNRSNGPPAINGSVGQWLQTK